MLCSICGRDLVPDAVFCPHCLAQVDGAEECVDYEYEAFISYRHLPKDRAVAIKLQRSLEGFRIPRQLREATGKAKLGRCFRDEDELPTSDSLNDQIEEALKRSRYLVVVCTPQTRESRWVQREVELFSSYHGRRKVLIALAEGEPDESFPDLLLTQTTVRDDGTLAEEPVEPLAADFRDLSRKKFAIERLRIASTLIGCAFDDLRQRMRLRTTRMAVAASLVVATVSAAFGGMATYQEARIRESYRQIQIKESEYLAQEADELLEQGDRYQAVQVALAGLPDAEAGVDRPFVPAAQRALENALGVYPPKTCWSSCYSQDDVAGRGTNSSLCFGDDGLEAVVARDRVIEVRETATSDLVSRFDAEGVLGATRVSSSVYCTMVFAGDKLVVAYDGVAGCFDVHTGVLAWRMDSEDVGNEDGMIAASPSGDVVAIAELPDNGRDLFSVSLLSVEDGSVTARFELPGYTKLGYDAYLYPNLRMTFSPDGSHLAVGWWQTVFSIEVASGETAQAPLRYEEVISLDYVDSLLTVVSRDQHHVWYEQPVCLEVFDASLTPTWSREETLDIGFDQYGGDYWHDAGVRGTWNYYRGDDAQLVVAWGRSLLLLDERSGEEVLSIDCDAPLVACAVLENRGIRRIYACTGEGTLLSRIPYESNEGKGGTVSDTALGTGMLQCADFRVVDGRILASLWKDYGNKRLTYRLWESSDAAESWPFEAVALREDLQSGVWGGDVMALLTEEQLLFFDGASLEPLSSIALTDLPLIDSDEMRHYEYAFAKDGDLYLLGATAHLVDGRSGLVVYRVHPADASAEVVLTIGWYPYVYGFDVVSMGDGAERLLIAGSLNGSDRVYLLDPDDPWNPDTLIDVQVEGIEKVWWAGESLIAYYESYSDGSGFKLFDVATGEERACDLARYDLYDHARRDTFVSLSEGGERLVVACADGFVRLFDAHTGALVWETDQTSPRVQLLEMTGEDNVFVLDEYGSCVLVSGDTGEVLQASPSSTPRLTDAFYHESDNTLVATVNEAGLLGRTGLALISLDEDGFGPLSFMYEGMVVSTDNELLLYEDSWTGELRVMRRPSLAELIALGKELVEGHELSDAELSLYLSQAS